MSRDYYHAIESLRRLLLNLTEKGFPSTKLSPDGRCAFRISSNPETNISVTKSGQSVVLGSYIVPYNAIECSKDLLISLLQWNYAGNRLNGAILGLCPQYNQFTLTAEFALETLCTEILFNVIHNFSNTAQLVSDQIREAILLDSRHEHTSITRNMFTNTTESHFQFA